MDLPARELALHLCRCAREKGGEGLKLMQMPPGYGLFDYGVLVNGRSDRQVHTLVGEAYHFCKRHGIAHKGIEGDTGWQVLDCGDVVFHAFLPETRDYYAIEDIWSYGTPIEVEDELKALPTLDPV